MTHTSVLLQEAVGSLALREGMTVLDATFGGGGHSRAIAEVIGRSGRLVSLDADEAVFTEAKVRELEHLTTFVHVGENFRHVSEILKRLDISGIDAALFDLGLSSTQLEHSGRGFSFQRDEPLLMTFKQKPEEGDVTAELVVNRWREETLKTILQGFGEERFAARIAKGIIEAREAGPIVRTSQLVEVIHDNTPNWYHRGRTHFATRTFQALRMAVNDELGAIESGISGAVGALRPGGRVAVISFHSIEDRAVKRLFRTLVAEGTMRAVTKKPLIPQATERTANPRARSAKLRVAEKVS